MSKVLRNKQGNQNNYRSWLFESNDMENKILAKFTKKA